MSSDEALQLLFYFFKTDPCKEDIACSPQDLPAITTNINGLMEIVDRFIYFLLAFVERKEPEFDRSAMDHKLRQGQSYAYQLDTMMPVTNTKLYWNCWIMLEVEDMPQLVDHWYDFISEEPAKAKQLLYEMRRQHADTANAIIRWTQDTQWLLITALQDHVKYQDRKISNLKRRIDAQGESGEILDVLPDMQRPREAEPGNIMSRQWDAIEALQMHTNRHDLDISALETRLNAQREHGQVYVRKLPSYMQFIY